jgi:molybdate transport system ATP-binding protein
MNPEPDPTTMNAATATPCEVTASFSTTVGAFTVTAAFTASPGITALFGPSGSGKSVTLATIAGLLRPDHGSIVVNGAVVADTERRTHVRTQDRRLGMVFQHAALLPHRSPLDNVALAVRSGTKVHRRSAARALLEQVRADHLADAPTRTLSGGEQQRVALARALAGAPRLLLLDEPFSALDLPTRTALRQLVREIVDTHHLSAIVVTHDLDDIAHLADRVVLYEPGHTTTSHDLHTAGRNQLPRILGLTP